MEQNRTTSKLHWLLLMELNQKVYSMWMNHGVGPALKTNVLNCFKDPLEACLVACGLNRELISHLTYYPNQYAQGKLNHINGTFVKYKWTNITMSKMYHFLGILLKMSLVTLDVDGLKSIWYPPTHAIFLLLTMWDQWLSSWAQWYMSYSRFVQICAAFQPESGTSKEGD